MCYGNVQRIAFIPSLLQRRRGTTIVVDEESIFVQYKRRSPHPSCLRQSTFSAGEGLNVAALSAQGNEIYQTCRGRRPDLLRKLTTRENKQSLQDNILLYAIQQPCFLIKIVRLSRVAEDVDPYNFKSKTQRQIKI